MTTSQPFKRIALISRHHNMDAAPVFTNLIKHLNKQSDIVYIQKKTAENLQLPPHNLSIIQDDTLANHCDLLLSVGGDGNFLNTAQLALTHDLPILGINRGRLGFLADVYPHELEKITSVLDGNYIEEQRTVLTCAVSHTEQVATYCDTALNEITLSPKQGPKLIEFEIMINGQFVCTQRSDGLIIATPTGSTAYALSGGGPILYPSLNVVVLVPIFSHNLSSRPIVINADDTITIQLRNAGGVQAHISCDSRPCILMSACATLHIKKYEQTVRLIHPHDYNYFQTLRSKLHWESKEHVGTSAH